MQRITNDDYDENNGGANACNRNGGCIERSDAKERGRNRHERSVEECIGSRDDIVVLDEIPEISDPGWQLQNDGRERKHCQRVEVTRLFAEFAPDGLKDVVA